MKVEYGKQIAEVQSAAGVTGILCPSALGGYFLRVNQLDGSFVDYELRHSDMTITIHADEEAAFDRFGDEATLDHAPATLGLKVIT